MFTVQELPMRREVEPRPPSSLPLLALGLVSFGLATLAAAAFMAFLAGGC
jgi:hypothetical protein